MKRIFSAEYCSVSPHSSSVSAKMFELERKQELQFVNANELMSPFMEYVLESDSELAGDADVSLNETRNQVLYFNPLLMSARPESDGYVVDCHDKPIGTENQKPDWVISYANKVAYEHEVGAMIELKAGEAAFDNETIYQAVGRINWIFHNCGHRRLIYVCIINYRHM